MDDHDFMRLTLSLARKGEGRVSPNPLVGAVLVKNGYVLSKGYHAFFGGPHAEVQALQGLSPQAVRGATLYVNLEPCAHQGKTPPCTESIIQAGIRRVVAGMEDPNPLVSGAGIKRLKSAGVKIETGVLEESCRELNRHFIKFITRRIPYVTLKIAQTLDGRIALPNGKSKWITGEDSRRRVQRLRRAHDAVLVGVNTVISDDPQLTVRFGKSIQPRRIVLDSRLRIPLTARILQFPEPEKTILVTREDADPEREKKITALGVRVWRVRPNASGRIDLDVFLRMAADAGIASILVEGGSAVFTSFLREKRADRMIIFTSPKVFGEGISPFSGLGVTSPENAITFQRANWSKVGSDMMFDGRF